MFFKKKRSATNSDSGCAPRGPQAEDGAQTYAGGVQDWSPSNPGGPVPNAQGEAEGGLPLSYARPLSWLSLVVILLTSLGLSFFISNSARETLLTRQEGFARLLVENLNSQIFRRFALPTLMGYGRIALRQPAQYDRLDQVVQSVLQGLPVERLRI